MVAGKDAATPGEGKNSWLTGTAAWTFTTISQYILGIKPEFAGLRIDPCIPSDINGFVCDRQFRGSKYHITVDNSAGVQKGVRELTVNGEPVNGTVLPLPAKPGEFYVNVVMG